MNKITKEFMIELTNSSRTIGTLFHSNGCKCIEGKRGGVKFKCERWRINGKVKTWKTKPEAFEVPIKYGFGNKSDHYGYMNDLNCKDFHLESECTEMDKYYAKIEERRKRHLKKFDDTETRQEEMNV